MSNLGQSSDPQLNAGAIGNANPMLRRRLFFVVSALATCWILQPLFVGILLGAALAFLSEPVKGKLERMLDARRNTRKSIAISIATVALISIIFLLPFTAVVLGALEQISMSLGSLSNRDALTFLDGVLNKIRAYGRYLPPTVNPEQLTEILVSGAQKALSWLGQRTGSWLSELPSAIFTAVLAVLSWGYFLSIGRQLRITILRFLFPWPSERALLRSTFSELIRSLVIANILVSVIQAVIIGIFLAFAGVPDLLLWTSAAFFLSFIPVVGTAPITLGSALWCWTVANSPEKAIAMVVCAFVAGTSDNFIRPLIARGAGELNPFWLFLAMMGGLTQFGPAGFILGPFALALTISSAAALRQALKPQRIESQTCET